MNGRLFCIVLYAGLLSIVGQNWARTIPQGRTSMTDDEYRRLQEIYRCRGMDEETCELHKEMMDELKHLIAITTGQTDVESEESYDVHATGNCVIFTVDQLEEIINNLYSKMNNSSSYEGFKRRKRNLVDFKVKPYKKWTMPIKYKFDGQHDSNERQIIRNAAQHWMDNTCVRFTEIPDGASSTSPYILITNQQNSGCNSNVGQVATNYQIINLADNCLLYFGIPVHEFGHSLGLFHEQARTDSEAWITLLWNNLKQDYTSQFIPQPYTNTFDVPYDFGSVMHYANGDFAIDGGKGTILAKNSRYQMNMGQRTGLSFNNIKHINRAYCSDSCSGRPLSRPCQNGGYQNPNDCSRCHCPDGLGGDFCEKVAPPRNAQCGGEIQLRDGSDRMTIMSPGYESRGYYAPHQECSWLFKAPEGYKLRLTFDGPFGLFCVSSRACFHWVEVKYKADIALEGARFCCYNKPDAPVISESNQMMVVFKSNFTYQYNSAMRGFNAHITLEMGPSVMMPVMPVIPVMPVGGLDWQCSFEPRMNKEDQLCGMIQDNKDNFDWTIFTGPTPSDPTGPDFAADGAYYIYIEASDPRRPNDEARLSLPDFNGYTGEVCLDFSYHMFGFHIRALKIVELAKGSSSTKELWSRYGEIGNVWQKASLTIRITAGNQYQFVGVRGSEYSGDIALDNIKAIKGKCPQ